MNTLSIDRLGNRLFSRALPMVNFLVAPKRMVIASDCFALKPTPFRYSGGNSRFDSIVYMYWRIQILLTLPMIAPERRIQCKAHDHRKPNGYKKPWKVERLFAWMHTFRRIITRWELHIENLPSFVQLTCIHIVIRRL